MIRKIKIGIAVIFGSFLLLVIAFLVYVEFSSSYFLSEKELLNLESNVELVYPLPKRFVKLHNNIHSNSLNDGVWLFDLKRLFKTTKRIDCPCYRVGRRAIWDKETYSRWSNLVGPFAIARYLESRFSQKDCLAYELSVYDYTMDRIGIEMASEKIFNKNLDELSDEEMINLIVRGFNPLMYSERFPEKLETKTKEIINELEPNNGYKTNASDGVNLKQNATKNRKK